MTTKYWWCAMCDDGIRSYAIDEETEETTFPRGEFLVHNDYIVTGFNTREKAQEFIDGPNGEYCRAQASDALAKKAQPHE